MYTIRTIILGIVQGIGEFLPISSSAHLLLIPYLFDWPKQSMAFDVALHFGTLLAVLAIFFKDWWKLLIGFINKVKNGKESFENKMFWYLVLATIPGVLFGLIFDNIIEDKFRETILPIALLLAVMGVLIFLGDRWASKYYIKETDFLNITLKQALIVGFSQALAIVPGFSRSGVTILAGRLVGLSKEAATKFTFLLSVPIVLGACIIKIPDFIFNVETVTGVLVSFVVGLFSIKFLLSYVKKHDFSVFAIYRILFSFIILVKYFVF